MDKPNMTITDRDRCRLGHLLTCERAAAYGSARSRFDLELTLEEASTVASECTPESLVTMNSQLMLTDLASGEQELCILVYPEDREIVPNSVGILQQLGLRLLGRCVGDVVELQEGNRIRSFRIESLSYQPEAAGNIHL
jgi:regulator of nucleoside diphosphate kinase